MKKIRNLTSRIMSGGILSNRSGQDNLEYTIMGLVAVLIAGIIWAAFRDGPFKGKVQEIFDNWISQ